MPSPDPNQRERRVYLDLTHVGRHVTGIERIAIELFEKVNFEGADVRPVRAGGTLSMIFKQQVVLPLLALIHPRAHFIFPGFPPAPWFVLCRNRIHWYVHDLFLITRRQDLSTKAKLYMARPFGFAARRLKHFLVNSQKTKTELEPFVAQDARIQLYRPKVENVFQLETENRAQRTADPKPLKLVSVGTVEPRKNYAAAVAICERLVKTGHPDIELHIIGRAGWGNAADAITNHPKVIVHGYLSAQDVKRVLEEADVYLCTSFDEGLGLPLLEAQYAGLPVFAPDAAVFHEVLADSGRFIPLDDIEAAATAIARFVKDKNWRANSSSAARANVERWNGLASGDMDQAKSLFASGLDDTVVDQSLGQVE